MLTQNKVYRHEEHAPAMLFMPIYFVLGQHGIQSPSRHDFVISTDLLRGEGTLGTLESSFVQGAAAAATRQRIRVTER